MSRLLLLIQSVVSHIKTRRERISKSIKKTMSMKRKKSPLFKKLYEHQNLKSLFKFLEKKFQKKILKFKKGAKIEP